MGGRKGMNIVECKGLNKVFGKYKALKELTFNIDENKITGLIGKNGAGKTTLLRLIAGFTKATSGDIKVFSENPFNSINVSSKMIFIDDNMALPQGLSLMETLIGVSNFYENWNMELAKGLFNYFDFKPEQRHNRLSKGMKSTFNMILGIAARCELTIFDEPTTGMDAGVRKDFYRALLKDYVIHPRTIIISSHHLNEIEDILEDILLIKDGEKCLQLPVVELKELAIELKGKTNQIDEVIKNKEIFHREDFGRGNTKVVVKNEFEEVELYNMSSLDIEVSPVEADDICIYLTSRDKGGIDDVFNR